MIIEVSNLEDCKTCDKFLTLLIQDERKYDNTIDENFVVKDYFINMINSQNILLLYKNEIINAGYIFAKKIENGYLIDGLYVNINFRGNGIAKKLINEAIKKIYLLGDYKIFINVLKENKTAVNLYKNMGFIIEEENKNKFLMIYNKYKLVNASITDLERIKKYKFKTIFEYANNLEQEEKERINNYVNRTIPNQIDKYKNIIINDNIVGSVLLIEIEDGILLDEIYIEEPYRNKGIGTIVIKNILSDINSNIYLWVHKDNVKAINLYTKLGFSKKVETDSRYYMKYLK